MSHPTDESRSHSAGKPTLEALLRVKRAERPDAAFWEEFDRGLRRKQLAAIIEPRPWWLGLSLLARRLVPVGLPVSATAAALLAVMVVRTQQPFAVAPGPVAFGPGAAPRASGAASPAPESVAPAPVLTAAPLVAVVDEAPVSAAARPLETASELAAAGTPAPADTAAPAPEKVVASLLDLAPAPPAPSPSQLAIAQNLAAVSVEEPALVATAAPSLVAAAELAEPASEEAAPLKMQVFTPRHARILLAMSDNREVAATNGIAPVRERMVHRLNADSSVYDSVSRLGVGGDRLSVSF